MRKGMRVFLGLAIVALAVVGLNRTMPVLAGATTVTQSVTIPVETFQYLPCANEYVSVSGQYHTQWHVTIDSGGTAHTESHANDLALSGMSTSGVPYHLVGAAKENWNFNYTFDGLLPYETTLAVTNRLIGEGTAPELIFRSIFHITVNANGEVTAQAVNFEYECRQQLNGKPTPTPGPYPAPAQ